MNHNSNSITCIIPTACNITSHVWIMLRNFLLRDIYRDDRYHPYELLIKKIYLVQISNVLAAPAPAPEENPFTATAVTLEYLVLLPGTVTAL